MTHYDVLGVGKDATPEQIQKAYRRMSSKHHPDRKGGSTREMAAINKAYECLSDREKRTYYDLHGEEQNLSTLEQQALQIIYQILSQLIGQCDEGDFVTAIVANLKKNLSDLRQQQPQLEKRITKLERQRKCIRRKKKDKENLLDNVFQQQIDAIREKIADLPEAIELGKRALEIMEDYENAFEGFTGFNDRARTAALAALSNDIARGGK